MSKKNYLLIFIVFIIAACSAPAQGNTVEAEDVIAVQPTETSIPPTPLSFKQYALIKVIEHRVEGAKYEGTNQNDACTFIRGYMVPIHHAYLDSSKVLSACGVVADDYYGIWIWWILSPEHPNVFLSTSERPVISESSKLIHQEELVDIFDDVSIYIMEDSLPKGTHIIEGNVVEVNYPDDCQEEEYWLIIFDGYDFGNENHCIATGDYILIYQETDNFFIVLSNWSELKNHLIFQFQFSAEYTTGNPDCGELIDMDEPCY